MDSSLTSTSLIPSFEQLVKPRELCRTASFFSDSVPVLYYQKKNELDKRFLSKGLRIRAASDLDAKEIWKLAQSQYSHHQNLTPFWMYHILSFGRSLIVHDHYEEVVAYILLLSYLPDHISHGASMAVHPRLQAQSIGKMLYSYAQLEAMKSGAQLKYAIIAPENYASLHVIVNRCGGIITGYTEDLLGMGSRFIVQTSLLPAVLSSSEVATDHVLAGNHKHPEVIQKVAAAEMEAIIDHLDDGQYPIALIDQDFYTYPKSLMQKSNN